MWTTSDIRKMLRKHVMKFAFKIMLIIRIVDSSIKKITWLRSPFDVYRAIKIPP